MTNILFVDVIAAAVLLIAAYVPRDKPIVLRLVAALNSVRDRRYKRAWLRLRAWEVQHPLGRRDDEL